MNKTTLYQKAKTGKTQQWSIWVVERGKSGFPEVITEFGLTDGAKQTTSDIIEAGVNEGRSNATTALQQAYLTAERKIKKQIEHGYSEKAQDNDDYEIDFNSPFPKSLCFYKPKNSLEENKLRDLEKNNSIVCGLKRDGQMHVVRKTKSGVEIYSRRMDLVTEKYPHLLEPFSNLPDNTILLGEMILDLDGKDDFKSVSKICRSDPEVAIEKQEELGKVSYYAFDVAYLEGQNLLTTFTFKERLKVLDKLHKTVRSKYFLKVKIFDSPHDEALLEVKNDGGEGLVVWDGDGLMKSNEAFTLKGKAYRPNVIFKSKPSYETDMIVRFDPDNGIGEYGKGKHHGKVGSVFCYQLDDDENEVYLGKVGGGFVEKEREYYTTAEYPRVFEVKYDSVQPKTGALRFPVFVRDRTIAGDKDVFECVMDDKIKAARAMEEEESD